MNYVRNYSSACRARVLQELEWFWLRFSFWFISNGSGQVKVQVASCQLRLGNCATFWLLSNGAQRARLVLVVNYTLFGRVASQRVADSLADTDTDAASLYGLHIYSWCLHLGTLQRVK